MTGRRDRFGPVAFLAVAALLVCSFFIGAPGAQAGVLDTGPRDATLELMDHPEAFVAASAIEMAVAVDIAAEFLSFCYENESAASAVISDARALPGTRYESGSNRSGVGERCSDDLEQNDLMRPRLAPTLHPLRC